MLTVGQSGLSLKFHREAKLHIRMGLDLANFMKFTPFWDIFFKKTALKVPYEWITFFRTTVFILPLLGQPYQMRHLAQGRTSEIERSRPYVRVLSRLRHSRPFPFLTPIMKGPPGGPGCHYKDPNATV